MGEIFMYYSDGREERQVITFSNGENGRETDGVLIGEFVFSDKRQTDRDLSAYDDKEEGFDGNEETALTETGSFGIFPDTKKTAYMWILGVCCLGGLTVASIKRKH